MNIEKLQKILIGAARKQQPDERVPYAFEKRIMARLAAMPKVDIWSLWSNALWRAAAPCVAITLLLSAWSYMSPRPTPGQQASSVDLEHAVLAPLDVLGELQ